jgi:exo-beta-1,3-glucanase (GH17 family)
MNTLFTRLGLALASTLIAMTTFVQQPAHAVDTSALGHAFDTLHWIAYSPVDYDPDHGNFGNREKIGEDLRVLKVNGFGGVVTYGCTQTMSKDFTEKASELGLKIIIGVWDPLSADELKNAVDCAKDPNVLAVCIGNERLIDKYNMGTGYNLPQLKAALDSVRARTGKPVTTSQQHKSYTEQDLIDACDFEFPTIHPFWAAVNDGVTKCSEPMGGAEWTVDEWQRIKNHSGNKIVVAKEVGYPTYANRPQAVCNEQVESQYYVHLTQSPMRKGFCYFEAFDQHWKANSRNETEPYWGLFYGLNTPGKAHQPKAAVAAIKAVW